MSIQPVSFNISDFTEIEGLNKRLNLKDNEIIPKDIVINALKSIERRDRVKSFFTHRSVIIITGSLVFCTIAAFLMFSSPAAIAAIPTSLKVVFLVLRIGGLGAVLFGIYDNNDISNSYKYNAARAENLMTRLNKVPEGGSIKLTSELVPYLPSNDEESDSDTEKRAEILVPTVLAKNQGNFVPL